MKKIINDLWLMRRDLVSDGFNEAVSYISKLIPISTFKVPTGTECWTWVIPPKWSVQEGWIRSNDKVHLDIKNHPLHVMSYSDSIDKKVSKKELMEHLSTYPKAPNAIPFEFSYYEKKWGFCTRDKDLSGYKDDNYEVCIKSKFEDGNLEIGELVIPGKTKEEIILIAHLCHPCMANDNLSGVAVLVNIAQELLKQKNSKYTYRILFPPETIGSIAYLSKQEHLIPSMKYAIVIDCIGHDDVLSLQHSRQATTELDLCASHVFKNKTKNFREGAINEIIASDERTFNGPGVNIPSICISRLNPWSKGEWPYPEYHSSEDTPDVIKEENLVQTKEIIIEILNVLNSNYTPKRSFKGPVFLSRYGLWVDWRTNRKLNLALNDVMHMLEGDMSILDIANKMDIPYSELFNWVEQLRENKLIEVQ